MQQPDWEQSAGRNAWGYEAKKMLGGMVEIWHWRWFYGDYLESFCCFMKADDVIDKIEMPCEGMWDFPALDDPKKIVRRYIDARDLGLLDE